MPEFNEPILRDLPVWSSGGLVGCATVLDDYFTRRVLEPQRWNLNADGYPVSRSSGQYAYLHRLVYEHYKGSLSPGHDVDHENTNKLDARPENLRPSTRSVNIANSGKRTTNKSGFKGVSWDARNRKWRASIMVNYRAINLGRYETKEEAARAVNEAYRKHFPTVRVPNEGV